MTPKRTLAGAAAAVAAISGALALDSQASTEAPRTLVFNQPFTAGTGAYVDVGRKGISAGDMSTGTSGAVYDDAPGARVGTGDGIETFVSRRHDGTVSHAISLRLADGKIEVYGVVRHTDPDTPLAIV